MRRGARARAPGAATARRPPRAPPRPRPAPAARRQRRVGGRRDHRRPLVAEDVLHRAPAAPSRAGQRRTTSSSSSRTGRSTRLVRCRRACGWRRRRRRVAAAWCGCRRSRRGCCGAVDADVVALHQRHGAAGVAGADRRDDSRHEPDDCIPRYHPPRRVLLNRPLVDLAARRADAIITVSESAKRDIVRLYGLDARARARRPRSGGAVVHARFTIRPSSSACGGATAWPIASSCTSARSSRARTCRS